MQLDANAMGLRGSRRVSPIHVHKTRSHADGARESHFNLHISPEEFDTAAEELTKALD
jgi:hypothetical protein